MSRPRGRSGAGRGERGAVLVLSAMLMVVLLVIVAFAIDLGQGRFARRANQSAVDLAALDAGWFLSGHGPVVGVDARGACTAAVASASVNLGVSLVASGTGCNAFAPPSAPCTGGGTQTFTGGTITLTIRHPVPDAVIADPRYSTGVGVEDGADACERMQLVVQRRSPTTFGRIAGVDEIVTRSSAVVRGAPTGGGDRAAALLVLEREGCESLHVSGQGAVVVHGGTTAAGAEVAGWIHSDSAGSTTFPSPLQCTTNANARGYALYGTSLPAGGPSIVVTPTSGGTPGTIATYARSVGGRGTCCMPGGLSTAPVGGPIVSRAPADNRYNPPARAAVADLHATGYGASVTLGSLAIGTPLGGLACAPVDGHVFDGGGLPVTFVCPGGMVVANNRSVRIVNAPSVKFVGGVDVAGSLQVRHASVVTIGRATAGSPARIVVGGNGLLSFDVASAVYVGGTPSSCTAVSSCAAISVAGTMRVNTGAAATATCAPGPGAGGSATNRTRMATFGGAVEVTGAVSWCQTAIYVGASQAAYTAVKRTSGGLNCTVALPCPALTDADARNRLLVDGGGSTVTWTAPDQVTTPPDVANPFEGLALWTEATGTSGIKSTGTVRTTGVYFLPNARFEFKGQANAVDALDAQFYVRTLELSGQGELHLKPRPANAVTLDVAGGSRLIR